VIWPSGIVSGGGKYRYYILMGWGSGWNALGAIKAPKVAYDLPRSPEYNSS
jgi:hypothetical protein